MVFKKGKKTSEKAETETVPEVKRAPEVEAMTEEETKVETEEQGQGETLVVSHEMYGQEALWVEGEGEGEEQTVTSKKSGGSIFKSFRKSREKKATTNTSKVVLLSLNEPDATAKTPLTQPSVEAAEDTASTAPDATTTEVDKAKSVPAAVEGDCAADEVASPAVSKGKRKEKKRFFSKPKTKKEDPQGGDEAVETNEIVLPSSNEPDATVEEQTSKAIQKAPFTPPSLEAAEDTTSAAPDATTTEEVKSKSVPEKVEGDSVATDATPADVSKGKRKEKKRFFSKARTKKDDPQVASTGGDEADESNEVALLSSNEPDATVEEPKSEPVQITASTAPEAATTQEVKSKSVPETVEGNSVADDVATTPSAASKGKRKEKKRFFSMAKTKKEDPQVALTVGDEADEANDAQLLRIEEETDSKLKAAMVNDQVGAVSSIEGVGKVQPALSEDSPTLDLLQTTELSQRQPTFISAPKMDQKTMSSESWDDLVDGKPLDDILATRSKPTEPVEEEPTKKKKWGFRKIVKPKENVSQ